MAQWPVWMKSVIKYLIMWMSKRIMTINDYQRVKRKINKLLVFLKKKKEKSFTTIEKWKRKSVVSNSLWPHGLYNAWNSPGQNTGVGNLSLLQGIFPTQGPNPGLPHCRRILYQLSHRGNPQIRLVRIWIQPCLALKSMLSPVWKLIKVAQKPERMEALMSHSSAYNYPDNL